MSKSPLRFILMVFAIAIVGLVIWRLSYPNILLSRLESAILAAGACTENADCVVYGGGLCELGCYYEINQTSEEMIREMTAAFAPYAERDCHMDCPAPGEPICLNGRCAQR